MANPSQIAAFNYLPVFQGNAATLAANIRNAVEPITISATAATGTINYDVGQQSILYFTANASANWGVNLRGGPGIKLDTLLAVGQVITVVHMVTQGGTAYYNSSVQVDGVTVTPKYQGGSAWVAGNTSSIDFYTYTILKTAPGTFTVFTSQSQFK